MKNVRRGEAGDLVIGSVTLWEVILVLLELPVGETDHIFHFGVPVGNDVGGHVHFVTKDNKELLSGGSWESLRKKEKR